MKPFDHNYPPAHAALPRPELSQLQSEWLRGARSRLLRHSRIIQASKIVDLGCGWGQTTLELAERSFGSILGIDRSATAISFARQQLPEKLQSHVDFIQADSTSLPLEDRSVDLVFTQCSMLWMTPVANVLSECHRVLKPGGRLVAIEPDYGGLMEWPASIQTRAIWLEALPQFGGDPLIGRKLPSLLQPAAWKVDCYFLDRYEGPHNSYTQFLHELPLNASQRQQLELVESALHESVGGTAPVVQLPFWLISATRT
jgi:SAM-dependent methyltransferase